MKKKIAILGVSGSIGTSTIDVVRHHRDRFEIVIASTHRNLDNLIERSIEFDILHPVITDGSIAGIPEGMATGSEALLDLLRHADYDIVLNAVSGSAGLIYTIEAVRRGKDVALANKESLVMAGHLVTEICRETGARLIPVDSEHSALFQVIGQSPRREIDRLLLTASGGPFRTMPLDRFDTITPQDALKHPTWDMGAKVTIDSSTMMNKALEVMEAHWLFGIPYDHIEALIHPQSIVHSMVEFIDGSILSQMSTPSMKLPILYALGYPERIQSDLVRTKAADLAELTFETVEKERYPVFFLALEVARKGGLMPTILNAANEAAIELFLTRKISFRQIETILRNYMDRCDNVIHPDIETILETNRIVYREVIDNYNSLT